MLNSAGFVAQKLQYRLCLCASISAFREPKGGGGKGSCRSQLTALYCCRELGLHGCQLKLAWKSGHLDLLIQL